MDIENYDIEDCIDNLSPEDEHEFDDVQELQTSDNSIGNDVDINDNDLSSLGSSTDALVQETQNILAETQQELNVIRNEQGQPSPTGDSTTDFLTQLHEQNAKLNADIAEIEAAYTSGNDAWIADVEAELDQKERQTAQLEIKNNAYINEQEITREIRNEQDQMRWSDAAQENRTYQYQEEIAAEHYAANAESYAEAGDVAAAADAAEQGIHHIEQAKGYQERARQYESWKEEASAASDDVGI
ncbi:hypothetical protein S7335_535 [Synechococcus sp. PCC 7335]|uniref:hypothetical protein n=1 Tax=Synechococcus sp. (strain ATCC 29403 / PCC 7335) TaxID=91464 RepID=UPI00017EDD75|nr:hypothetical protein [Synechococcus sp. PCC 7335]EDX83355.1 hypothetical protein S7335_535 [Synechococcus sp. PCC 7335]